MPQNTLGIVTSQRLWNLRVFNDPKSLAGISVWFNHAGLPGNGEESRLQVEGWAWGQSPPSPSITTDITGDSGKEA